MLVTILALAELLREAIQHTQSSSIVRLVSATSYHLLEDSPGERFADPWHPRHGLPREFGARPRAEGRDSNFYNASSDVVECLRG